MKNICISSRMWIFSADFVFYAENNDTYSIVVRSSMIERLINLIKF